MLVHSVDVLVQSDKNVNSVPVVFDDIDWH